MNSDSSGSDSLHFGSTAVTENSASTHNVMYKQFADINPYLLYMYNQFLLQLVPDA